MNSRMAREGCGLVTHDERVAVRDLGELGGWQQLGQAPAVVWPLHPVLGRPDG
jgi:hypothetical protein